MATFRNASFGRMVDGTLKQAAAILSNAGVEFMLIGSLSAWVRGGPESSHDLDFGIRERDIVAAADAFTAAGFTIEIPPEDWLIKAWNGTPGDPDATLVDLIYAPSGMVIDDAAFDRADEMDVLAHRMMVLSATDLAVQKAMSLREQNLNLTSLMSTARAIREQIDWDELRERCAGSPYAAGFFVMAEQLGIAPPAGQGRIGSDVVAGMQSHARAAGMQFPHRQELLRRLSAAV